MKNGPIRTITPRAYLSFFAVALTCERSCTALISSGGNVRDLVDDSGTGCIGTSCNLAHLFYDDPRPPWGARTCSATAKCNDTSSNRHTCAGGKP